MHTGAGHEHSHHLHGRHCAGDCVRRRAGSGRNGSVPSGNPCLKGNGNPCNSNNGNIGRQGNAGHEKVNIGKKPPHIDLAMPPVSGRHAFITQVGDSNVASIIQTAPSAYAQIDQDGEDNESDVTQRGSGSGYIQAKQAGQGNFARLQQDGAGQNVVYLTQTGTSNWAWVKQNADGGMHNGALLTQTGDNNDLALFQDGTDNRALLSQEGDGNGMTAVQNGEGNRLVWTQQGTNLTDLQITQTGGAAKGGQLLITQTGTGGGK
jgi:hypothetical protein